MSCLYFKETTSKNAKTRQWEVENVDTGAALGFIRFFRGWMKYVFAPLAGTVYDESFLEEILKFTKIQTEEWRAKQKPRSAGDA